MKKIFYFYILSSLLSLPTLAKNECFLAKENGKVIQQIGICKLRRSPCSSFKIAVSLMAYDEGILIDERSPLLPFREGYLSYIDEWKQDHNPTLWMKTSCLWFTLLLIPKIGLEKFKSYVEIFKYGNQDVSGGYEKKTLTHACWNSGSLEISPEEQTLFLQKLVDEKLPVSNKAHKITKNIIFVENLREGWRLYGKTGFCSMLNQQKTKKLKNHYNEWFVGWIEKDGRAIVFASYVEHQDKHYNPMGREAKVKAKENLLKIIQKLK